MKINGLDVTIIGAPHSTQTSTEFSPLPVVEIEGNEKTYVVIPGSCSIGLALVNKTKTTKSITVSFKLLPRLVLVQPSSYTITNTTSHFGDREPQCYAAVLL
jgi:hypothetical protein